MAGRTLQSTIEIAGTLSPSLQQAIRQAIDRLEEMSEETLESAGAAARLADEIGAQESVLRSLQRGYADYIVSGRESSDEARQLASRIQDLSDELDENRDTLEAAERAARDLIDAQDDTADAYEALQRTISKQQDDLEALQREYANLVLEQGESSDEAQELAGRISRLSGELGENRQQLENAERAADRLGDTMEDAGQQAEDSSEGYTVLKNVIANLATEAINKAVDAFKELATEGDSALAMLEARTGATSSEMEGFEDVMYEVYNANYGESLGDVSEKLSTVIQMTDNLDNASLANVTKNAIALEDVFGFDIMESMRGVNSLMDQFGITSDQAFNLIVQGAQKGLNQNDDLLDTINEYSVQFKNAGYSADDMFNMLANGVESGTWSVDKLGDAVKEFNIRMSDGSAKEAVEALGFSWEKVSEDWSKGGDSAKEVFNMLVNELDGLETTTEGYNIGVGLLGTMYEDLGQEAVLALSNTEGAINSASDAMAQMDSAAYDTLESSLSQLGRTVKAEVVQPIAEKLTPAIKDSVNFVNERVGPAVEWLLSHLPEVGIILGTIGSVIAAMKWGSIVGQISKISGAFSGFKTAIAAIPGPVLAIIAIVAALAAGFMYLWETNEDFRNNVTAVWEELQGSFSELGGKISDMLNQLMPLISEIASTVLTAFGQIAEAVLPILIQLISELLPVIISLIDQLLPVLTQIIESVLTVLVDVINQLLPLVMQIIEAVLPVLLQLVQAVLPIITQIVEAVLPVLIQLINTILPIITQIISAVLPVLVEILNALTPILNMVISLLQPILNLIISLVEPILNLIMAAIQPLIEIFATLISTILEPIMPILSAVANVITSVLGAAIQAIQPIIQSLTSVFQGLIDFITGVFSGNWSQAWNGIVQVFGGLWDGLVAIVKAPINAVIGLINKAIGALNSVSVTIPDWVPVVGGNTFGINIPTIPMLASGGFTDGVSIAGEAGMEAVISFDKRYHDENVAIWERAGQMLGTLGTSAGEGAGLTSTAGKLLTLDDFSLGSLANDASTVIYYDFSGFTWSPQIQTGNTGDDTDDFMAQLRAHEAEFFDWLEEFIQMREVAQYA
ncbi:phage tail tape measure protein [Anaerotruncus colihominis]|uniref:phage tail tape measure protein n=1 Tax=Anaerotruncus colihominis TaxID=169435 RepID=UPI00242EA23C|nr:phage tail tape measure protein [Anaerotruncus colihominis]